MMIVRLTSLVLFSHLIFLFVLQGHAQYFDSGQDAASLHWKQINSGNFKLIYPDSFSVEAERFANLLETALPRVSESLNHKTRKNFGVIIHNQSAFSNGMVSWSPGRMDIYPVPPQSSYPQDWLEQLAIHELRHRVQLDKLNTGKVHWLTYLFGEQIVSLVAGLYVPSWFIEGDAVVTETALSKSGRGRLPNFEMELRAQFLEDRIYSYDKAVFGSYKNYIPDRYTLGYYLVGTARILYGKEIWENALDAVTRNPFVPNPFNRGIKRRTGQTEGKLYFACMQHLDTLWKQQDKSIQKTRLRRIKINENSEYADYHYPAYMDDGAYFALRSSMDDITRFIRIDSNGKISTLFTPGNINEDALSYSNGKIYWAEYIPDLRWDNRNWSVIKVFDIHTKKTRQLGRKTRWYAPAPSNDGNKIAVVEVSPGNHISLVILNSLDGNVIKRISTTENYFFLTPSWDAVSKNIITIIQGEQGKAIAEVNESSGELKILTGFSHVEISGPIYAREGILFLGGYNGIDNIYLLYPNTGEIMQISSSRLGAHDAGLSDDGTKVLYVEYTAHGHNLVESNLSDRLSIPLDRVKLTSPRFDSILSLQEGGPIQFHVKDSTYKVTKYHKSLNVINFHSWAPVYIDAGNAGLAPGISLMSQNLLSTSFLSLGYLYNRFEKTGKYIANFTYKGFYPVIDLNYSNGLRASTYKPYPNSEKIRFTYGEEEIQAKLSLPLNLSRGRFYRSFVPSAGMTYFSRYMTTSSPKGLITDPIQSLDLGITAYSIVRYSNKDLQPRWGQVLRMQHRSHFPGINDSAKILSIITDLYFPGFFRHHSWKISMGYQGKSYSKYYGFSDYIDYPRGYSDSPGKEFTSLSIDYVFPIFYPEWSIPRILYLKRVSGDIFTDFAMDSGSSAENYNVVGAELSTECHLFRFYAPIDLGIRSIFNTSTHQFSFEFLYSINLASF